MLSRLTETNELEFRPYTAELVESVKAFNQRLREGGDSIHRFPETHITKFLKQTDIDIYQQRFLLLHNGQVRGGYILTHQTFAICGHCEPMCCGPQLALSEGIVDPRYGMFGVLLVEDALARQPLMYALGMGGMQEALSKLLTAMGWTLYPVPFYFKVIRSSQFLANITYLRKRRDVRLAVDFLRYTGLGSFGLRLAQFRVKPDSSMRTDSFENFEDWAEKLWDRCRDEYSLISLRDSKTLNVMYPLSDPRFLRLKVSHGPDTLGWVVMLDTQMSGHKQFGNMRVGSIVDCLARPEHAPVVIQAATRYLENRGVDIIVSNQTGAAWCKALAKSGFLAGPSNFILGLSQSLVAKLHPLEHVKDKIHMNRGNGDGPINL